MTLLASRLLKSILLVAIGVAVVATTAFLVWQQPETLDATDVLTYTVRRADFISYVTESGDIESSANHEIRCEVKSPNSSGATILKIIDEGQMVQQGDFVMQFDDSQLQNDKIAQEILVARDKAAVIQAQSDLSTAEQTLQEYEQGIYAQERELLAGEVVVAEENLKRSRAFLDHSSKLAAKGFVPTLELEADRFAVKKAEMDVQVAQQKLNVYEKFTRQKMVSEYKAEIEKQKANLEAAENTLRLSQRQLADIVEQIERCTVRAPIRGQLIFGNETERRGDDRIIIEEGITVREGQVVARIPDPTRMQVDSTINETKVKDVKVGDPVEIVLDSDPTVPLKGKVTSVNSLPYPQRWFGGPLEYGCKVAIMDPPGLLKPGMRCKVKIMIENRSDVIQAPLGAVVARKDRHLCFVRGEGGQWESREVELGSTNDRYVVIESGLAVGEVIALNASTLAENVELDTSKSVTDGMEALDISAGG